MFYKIDRWSALYICRNAVAQFIQGQLSPMQYLVYLVRALNSKHEGVNHSGFYLKSEAGFGRKRSLSRNNIALSDNLHTDHSLALGPHVAKQGARCFYVGVHMSGDRKSVV